MTSPIISGLRSVKLHALEKSRQLSAVVNLTFAVVPVRSNRAGNTEANLGGGSVEPPKLEPLTSKKL